MRDLTSDTIYTSVTGLNSESSRELRMSVNPAEVTAEPLNVGVESGVGGGGDGCDASPPPVTNLGGDVPPDSRMKWSKSGAFSDF